RHNSAPGTLVYATTQLSAVRRGYRSDPNPNTPDYEALLSYSGASCPARHTGPVLEGGPVDRLTLAARRASCSSSRYSCPAFPAALICRSRLGGLPNPPDRQYQAPSDSSVFPTWKTDVSNDPRRWNRSGTQAHVPHHWCGPLRPPAEPNDEPGPE